MGKGVLGGELGAAKKCPVNVLLNESWEVKAGKGFRETPATCSFGAGRLRGGGRPSFRVGFGERSGAPRRQSASRYGEWSGNGADPGR